MSTAYDGVDEAFELLLSELQAAQTAEDRAGADAFARHDHEGVRRALAKAEHIKGIIRAAEDLRRRWSGGGREQERRSGGKVRQPGLQTPHRGFRIPILRALVELGGRAEAKDVLRRIEPIVEPFLTEADRRVLKGGVIRWVNAAQWARYEMIKDGLLRSGSPLGVWEITDEGRRYLEEHAGEDR